MKEEDLKIIQQIKEEPDFFNKAKLIQYISHEREVPIKDIASHLEMQSSYVCHIMRLNKLPPLIIDGYYSKLVSLSHLYIIARLKTQEDMIKAYETVLSDSLTALQTERLVREVLFSVSSVGEKLSREEIEVFTENVRKGKKAVSVSILQTRIKGRVAIEVKGNLEQTTQWIRQFIAGFKAIDDPSE